MNNKLIILAQRRERLILEAARQREQIAQIADSWRPPLAMADKGLAAVSFIKKHPIWMAGGSALVLKVLRPRRIGKWFQRGLLAWQLVRKLRGKFLV
jgi:hypothetical protein